jgi:hypothetical protein
MGIPQLYSTLHWISTTVNGREDPRFAQLCLGICDIRDNGTHVLWAHAPAQFDIEFEVNGCMKAKFARVNAIYFGVHTADDEHWRSSTAFAWSETLWPPQQVHEYESSFCEHSCVAAALRKAEQDQTDLVLSALVQVEVAIREDDDEWLTIDSLHVSSVSEPGDVLS